MYIFGYQVDVINGFNLDSIQIESFLYDLTETYLCQLLTNKNFESCKSIHHLTIFNYFMHTNTSGFNPDKKNFFRQILFIIIPILPCSYHGKYNKLLLIKFMQLSFPIS